MIYTPFEYTIPAPYGASFVDGEKVISPFNPINSAPPRSERTLSRWIYLAAGKYVLRTVSQSSATWLLNTVRKMGSTLVEEKQLLFTTLGSEGVTEREFIVSRSGVKKLDVILRNGSASLDVSYFAFNIRRGGSLIYASSLNGWKSSDTNTLPPSALGEMPDYRDFLPVFTINPNWQGGVLEKLSYLTNILESSTDAEQRRMMRIHPRRSFEASFLREKEGRSRLENFISGHGHEPFLVPLWHEAIRLPFANLNQTLDVTFTGYNLTSNGASTSNGSQISCGLFLP